jgi:hypothetical protein
MAEIRTNQVNGDDKQLKGLQSRGLIDFDCADCGKRLLVLQLTTVDGSNKTEVLTRVAVKCCECNGFSYVKQIPGQFHPGAPSDQMGFDILDNDIDAPEADVLFKAWNK